MMITDHAVQRFVERHQRGLGTDAARKMLVTLVRTSTLHEVERGGKTEIWRTPCGILIVISKNAVKTVLPRGAMRRAYRPQKRRR